MNRMVFLSEKFSIPRAVGGLSLIFVLLAFFPSGIFAEQMPVLVFEDKKDPVTSIFMGAFQKQKFTVFSKEEYLEIKKKRANALKHKVEETQDHLEENLDESDGRSSLSSREILGGMASARANGEYKVEMDYEVIDVGVNSKGFYEVVFILNSFHVSDLRNEESLMKENGKEITGKGPNKRMAEIKSINRLAGKLAKKTAREVKSILTSQSKGKPFKLTVAKIIDDNVFHTLSGIIKDIIGTEPSQSFDEAQFVANYKFTVASSGVNNFVDTLKKEMAAVDEIEGIKVLSEQSTLKSVNIMAAIEYP